MYGDDRCETIGTCKTKYCESDARGWKSWAAAGRITAKPFTKNVFDRGRINYCNDVMSACECAWPVLLIIPAVLEFLSSNSKIIMKSNCY